MGLPDREWLGSFLVAFDFLRNRRWLLRQWVRSSFLFWKSEHLDMIINL